jgi:transposase-like protein
MTRHSPHPIVLSAADRAVLERRSRDYTARHADVVRARIVLLCADGLATSAVARRLDVPVDLVRTWRRRFVEGGLDGLADRSRTVRRRAGPAEPAAAAAEVPGGPGARVIPFPGRHDGAAAIDALRQLASSIDRYLAEVDAAPARHRAGGPRPRRR